MYKRNTCAIRLGAMMLLLSGAMNAHATLIGDEVDVLVTVPVNNGGFTVIDGTETVSDSVVEFPFSSNIITNLNMSVDFGESSVALRVKNDLPCSPVRYPAPLGIVFELDNLNWLGFDGGIVNVVGLRNTLPIADVSFDEDSIRIATVAGPHGGSRRRVKCVLPHRSRPRAGAYDHTVGGHRSTRPRRDAQPREARQGVTRSQGVGMQRPEQRLYGRGSGSALLQAD